MVNDVFVDDKKIKDILTYISGMKHAEQIRMMFLSVWCKSWLIIKTSQPRKDILIIMNTCSQTRLKMQECDSKLTPSKKALHFL